MNVLINSPEILEQTADCYHDGLFCSKDIIFSEKEKKFSLTLTRVMWEKSTVKINLLIFQKYVAPRIVSILSFSQVNKMTLFVKGIKIFGEDPVDYLNAVNYYSKEHRIEFKCIHGTVINLMVEQLDGKFEDTDEKLGDSEYFSLFGLEFGRD